MGKQESAFFDSLYWGLLTAREPKVMTGLADYEHLTRQFKEGKSRNVRRALEGRGGKVVRYWMRMFGSKRGAPRKHDPFLFRVLGVYKRKSGLSWNELAKRVNRDLFRNLPSAYSVQQAVRRAEVRRKASRRPSKP